jgi:hypothetical protein
MLTPGTPRRPPESLAVLAMLLLLAAAMAAAFLRIPAEQRLDVLAAVARAGWPLLLLFSVLLVGSVLLFAVLRSRRRSAVVAVCLLFSAALHLLTASLLSLWVIQSTQRVAPLATGGQRVELGLPSSTEGTVSQEVRERLLESRVTDAHTLEASRADATALAEINVERQRANLAAAQPDRRPLPAPVATPATPSARPSVDARLDAKMQAQAAVDAALPAPAKPAEVPAAHEPDANSQRAERPVEATQQRTQTAADAAERPQTPNVTSPDRQAQPEAVKVDGPSTRPARTEDDLSRATARATPAELPVAAQPAPDTRPDARAARAEAAQRDVPVERREGAAADAAETPVRPRNAVRVDAADAGAASMVAAAPNMTPRQTQVHEQVEAGGANSDAAIRQDVLPGASVAAAPASAAGADRVERQAAEAAVSPGRQARVTVPEASPAAPGSAPTLPQRESSDASVANVAATPVSPARTANADGSETLASAASPARTAGERLTGIARRFTTLLTGAGPERDSREPRGAAEVTAERSPGAPLEAAPPSAPAPVQLAAAVSPSADRPLVTAESRVETARTATGQNAGEAFAAQATAPAAVSRSSVLDVAVVAPPAEGTPREVAGSPANVGAGRSANAAVAPGYTRQVAGDPSGPVAPQPAAGAERDTTGAHASFERATAVSGAASAPAAPGAAESIAMASAAGTGVQQPIVAGVGTVRAATADAPEAAGPTASAAGRQDRQADLAVARAAGAGAPEAGGAAAAPRGAPAVGAATADAPARTLAGETAPMQIERQRDAGAGLALDARPAAPAGAVALAVAARSAERTSDGGGAAATAGGAAAARSDAMAGSPVERARLSAAAGEATKPAEAASAGGAGLAAAARGPAAMDVSVPSASESRALTPTDIATPQGAARLHKSLIAVGTPPPPESVPDKAIYQMRKPDKRRQHISELGGSPATEQAVEDGLDWLAKVQSDDGRWDIDGFKTVNVSGGAGDRIDADVAITGLSLLAYLGAGYTHADGKHKETVLKALDWVIGGQKPDGDLRRGGQMYDQAMATAALCEALSLTGDERLRPPAELAVQFILQAQTPESGWRYQPREDSDTSVTGWQILAMKSAQIAGLAIPEQHLRWTGMWLDKVRKGETGGLYTYKPGHAVTTIMTAEGWFCQLFMGAQGRTRGQSESVSYLMQAPPVWNPVERGAINLYYWYYATLALHLSAAPEFKEWNAALTRALLEGRVKSGPAAGSWEPSCLLAERGGRLYTTVMGCLCLEVYYRFMPLYQAPP